MRRRSFLSLTSGIPSLLKAQSATRPNIILIYADDIGYGDLSCYGATRVKTPNLDRVAAQGVRFTDAHSPSATCTPSRYALLTGEYAWRKPGTAILPGDANLIIEPGRTTLPSIMKQSGYATAAVGKWHLGLGKGRIDWNRELNPGPRDIGFDYSFLIPATGDRVPCVYVENHRVVGLDPKDPIEVDYKAKIGTDPTGKERPDLLKMKLTHGHDMTIVNGISRIGWMSGGKAARWVDEDMAATITSKATSFIRRNATNPFFLYFATHDIHVPRVPHAQFRGTTQCGVRCEAIRELDDSVGQILKTLEETKLDRNTLLIFTSDNGPVVDDGYADEAVASLNGHVPAGPLRGGKYSLYEGGTRLPFLAQWPARIRPAHVSNALICQIDLLATFAALTGAKVDSRAAPDSSNVLPALLGESGSGREWLVEHARDLAVRNGQWKLIPGGSATGDGKSAASDELYDLSKDLGEKQNVAAANADRVRDMRAYLERVRSAGHSRVE